MAASERFYRAAESRIEWLTAGVGTAAALVAAVWWGSRAAAGVVLGAALAWVNFRWLKQGVAALAQLFTARSGAQSVRIPKRIYAKFLGRFALLLAVVYVILSGTLFPAAAVLAGLFALVAAVLVELLYELLRGERLPDTG